MSLMEAAVWDAIMSGPISIEAANDGITIVVLLIAAFLIVFKPDFSKL